MVWQVTGLLLFASFVSAPTEGWQFIGGLWQQLDGQLVGESTAPSFALAFFSRYAKAQVAEVTMTPLQRMGDGWSSGGLCLFQDSGNFWRLALVEAPDGQTRYAELVAMHGGVWQAQTQWHLKVVAEINPQFAWQWNTPYRLRLSLTPSQIVGEVFHCDGQLLWRRAYALDNVPIVRAGWLALNVAGMKAQFVSAVQQLAKGEVVRMRNVRHAVVVRDVGIGNTKLASWLAAELRRKGLTVGAATLDDLSEPQWWQRLEADILVLPNARRLPVTAREPLLDFLRRGGKLIAFGAPLWGEPTVKVMQAPKTRWISLAEMDKIRRSVKPSHFLFPRIDANELSLWRVHASHPDPANRVSLEPLSSQLRIAQQAFRLDLVLKGWAIFVREFSESPFPKGDTLTCFWAKGALQTKALMVEWREVDGSRWFAHVPLTTDWRLIVLAPSDFTYRRDSPTGDKRGFAGDRFNPERARALVLGMEAPMPPGNHTFWIAGLGTAPDPFGNLAVDFEPPILEALSPAYKLYPLRKVAMLKYRELSTSKEIRTEASVPKDSVASVPRWRGLGFTGERVMRWLPLLTAHDENGAERGALAWFVQYNTMPYPKASWLVFGSADETFWLRHLALLRAVLDDVSARWQQGIWLLEAGADRFTAYPDEPLSAGAVVVNDAARPCVVRVHLQLTRNGETVWERQETLTVQPQSIATARVPLPPLTIGAYALAVRLGQEDKGVDEIRHTLHVTERPKVTEGDKVTIWDGHFIYQGNRWFAFGVNYWPRYVAGKEPSDYYRHWLDPTNYDPELVAQDLQILQEMGMNCVSIQYMHPRQALPLRDFLRRCHEVGIKVNLFIAGAHPLHFQPDLVRSLIEAADLPNQPALFAYDIAWEPRWGNYQERRRHDAEWRAWLVEQYGSVENAERDWGFSLPRDEQGNPTVPRDEHLLTDGEWRVMVAAYRRFLDDFISRKYREVVRFIRGIDPHHLIGARTGFGGGPFGAERAFPFDHTAGAKHLDFISPEGWNLGWLGQAEESQFARAVFITAYARWAGKGKPVFWAEFGLTLRHGAFSLDWYDDTDRLQAQAQLYEALYRLMQISDADGAMGWWFPGGYRVDERSDFGIVNPDGTLRPAAEVAKRWSRILTSLPMRDERPLATIRIDREENARGPMALWLKHGDEAVRLVQEGKRLVLLTDGTGKTSDDLLDVAVGNTPWAPGKPPKFLNGEINAVWVSTDGKKWQEVSGTEAVVTAIGASHIFLRVELGNTGEVAWLPPEQCRDKTRGIVLRISVEGGERVEVPIPQRVEPFADVLLDGIKVPLPKSSAQARCTLRLHWRGAPFGEQRQLLITTRP